MKQDMWSILQIAPTDSKREIRRAYAALAQKCHPEEQPEEFLKLQEAYQLALRYAEQISFESREEHLQAHSVMLEEEQETETDASENLLEADVSEEEVPDEVPDESPEGLLAAMERDYAAEQKCRQSEGALKELITLFEKPKVAKGNKAWAEFFLSDLFLREYFAEDFAESLDFYLEHQSVYACEELPQVFLVEWAIAYAMVTAPDGCMYLAGDIPMRRVIAKYWNQQDEMWRFQRGARMLVRAENTAKINAFSDYIALRMLERQGLLTEKNEYQWRELVWYGKPHFLYEVCKQMHEKSTSIILLRLFVYWISMEEFPRLLAEKMYQEYQLKENERSSYHAVYKELKQTILEKFPDIEKEDVQETIKEWAGRLIDLSGAFVARTNDQFEPETEEETADIEQMFSEDVWDRYWNYPFMIKWLALKLSFDNMPLTIAQHLYRAYSLPEAIDNYERMELHDHSMRAILSYTGHTEPNRQMFWEYFFQTGFGVCSIADQAMQKELAAGELRRCTQDGRLYLPAYMKCMYEIGWEKQKCFLGYRADLGRIDKPRYHEFTLPDGDVIRTEYYLHFIAYYRNGQRIYKPYLTYEALKAYEEKITDAEEFFCLLALTGITETDSRAVRELMKKWLPETTLVEDTFSVIMDCIIQNNALERSTDECAISETDQICLMVQRTGEKYALYEYSEFGWIERDFRAGRDWQDQDIDAVLKAHMKPVAKRIAAFEMKGLSVQEKLKVVWDSLILYAKHEKGAGLLAPVLPEEYPMLHTLFGEGGMGWLTDSFVVLYHERDNLFFPTVLYLTVGNYGCGPAYWDHHMTSRDEEKIQDLQNRVRRRKPEQFLLSGSIIKEYHEQQYPFIKHILFGESGKVYSYCGLARVCEAESAFELLSKVLDSEELEDAVRCEVYEGKMTVSAQSGQLEYCFTKEEYEEAYAAYEKDRDKKERYSNRCETLAEYYCVMK